MSDIGFGYFLFAFNVFCKTVIVFMRPGITRAFSTTQRRAQQQLFEPYIPPLNQEQRKAIRKIALADQPHYHGHINKDATWLFAVRALSELQLVRLLIICRRIAVRSLRKSC